jgi:hypothetical protein
MAGRGLSLRTLRSARIALVGMVLLCARVGEMHAPDPKSVNPSLRVALCALAVSIIPSAFWLRSKELKRAKERLARRPGDTEAVKRWRGMQLAILYCFLAIPLYGLILRFQGARFLEALPFYVAGVLLLSCLPVHDCA